MSAERIVIPEPVDDSVMTCICGATFTWPEICPGCGMTIEHRKLRGLLRKMMRPPRG